MATANDRRHQMFPKLEDGLIKIVEQYGRHRQVGKDELLFDLGDAEARFFVVISGHLRITQPDEKGGEDEITTHGPGEFTGELNLLSSFKPFNR